MSIAIGLAVLTATPAAAAPVAPTVEAPPSGTPDATCDLAPGVVGHVCGAVGGLTGGAVDSLAGSGADAVLGAMVRFVVDGAGWLVGQLVGFIESSTTPDLNSEWFRAAYRDMALIGMLGLLPFLLLAVVQALVRQDIAMMLRATFGYVPLAAIGTAGAVVVVDLLVRLTDDLSAWVARGLGGDLSAFSTGIGTALARLSAPSGGAVAGLAVLVGAALVAFAAFVIWLELLLRQAAIHVAVLFLPLGFMAMVWPATAHWLRRLGQGLVAIILSKFVIVAVMALAADALDAEVVDDGFAVVMSGGALLGLAALAPYVLLRLIPVFDAGMSSQLEGTWRRPTAAVGTPVHGSGLTRMLRQRAGSGGQSAGAPAGAAAGGPSTPMGGAPGHLVGATAGVGTAGVGLAAAGAAAGVRGASSTARRHAGEVAHVASGSGGNGRASASPQVARTSSTGPDRPQRRGQGDDAGEEG